jgi:LacI family transcriptional regulator
MKRKVTLKQIAKELDVSISTVSKSLKNSLEISEDTRQKIQAFAKLYNYKPNNIALSLKNRKTKTICIIIPEIIHHFFATVISGVENVANENGYNVLVCLSDESFDKEVINMEMLANGSIDGFIMSLSKETQQKKDFHHIVEVINQGMPVVMFDRVTNDILCDKVIIDDNLAAFNATQFLIDKGFRKIALITTVDYVSVGILSTQGYINALKNNDISVNENLILKIEDTENFEALIEDLLVNNDLDAIFAVNEIFAVTAIKLARKLNIKVPEELSIIGFTDGIISKYSTPSLSSISAQDPNFSYKLFDYYVKSSYNSCATGNFVNDWVDMCALKNTIKQGYRLLDFEIYDINQLPKIVSPPPKQNNPNWQQYILIS